MTDLGVEPFLIAPSLVGVVAQRLMRKVCTACAEKYVPDEAERVALGITEMPAGTQLSRGKGCNACHRTGHAGRVAVRELLEIDDTTRALIASGGGADAIRNHARSTGFRSMRFHALKLALAGVTSSREVMRMTRS
jgi:type II secretory ATPase GspE/PulE/Tfp pilus assembly ATPase PilB-like protein